MSVEIILAIYEAAASGAAVICISNDECCIQNDECCIENDECCIENDECCIEMMTSLLNPGQGIENTHAAKLAARYEVRDHF